MLTGRRYLLALTDEQATYAETVGDACRAVWNAALEQRREYRRRGAWITHVERARQVAEAKKDPYCQWLADAPSHTLHQTLRDLDKACRTHGTWTVRWRSKTRTAPSIRFPGHQDNADVNAAKNILAAGLAVTGREDLAVGRSVKQQPRARLAA